MLENKISVVYTSTLDDILEERFIKVTNPIR